MTVAIVARPIELLREEAALLAEHDALVLDHASLTANGCTVSERRAHAAQLVRHGIRLRAFIDTLQMWMAAHRAP